MNASHILDFYARLKENNNREWFEAHKLEYQRVKTTAEYATENILKQLSLFDKSLKTTTAKECIFRIYRDIRFSYDKTPYKTHLGIFIPIPRAFILGGLICSRQGKRTQAGE